MENNNSFTVGEATLCLDEPVVHQDFGYTTVVTQVRLAAPYRGHPAAKLLGRTQYRTGRRRNDPQLTAGLRGYCVHGIDYRWLVREFEEHNCGDLQSRKDSVQPGAVFHATRSFGYLGAGHDFCYVSGDVVEVLSVEQDRVRTQVRRSMSPQGTLPRSFVRELWWDLEALQSLVGDFALRRLPI